MADDPLILIQSGRAPGVSVVTIVREDVFRLILAKKGAEEGQIVSVLVDAFAMSQPDAIALASKQVALADQQAATAAEAAAALAAANQRVASLEAENVALATELADMEKQIATLKAEAGPPAAAAGA